MFSRKNISSAKKNLVKIFLKFWKTFSLQIKIPDKSLKKIIFPNETKKPDKTSWKKNPEKILFLWK